MGETSGAEGTETSTTSGACGGGHRPWSKSSTRSSALGDNDFRTGLKKKEKRAAINANKYKYCGKIKDFKVLKHFKGNHKEGAFIWHYDNHPKTITNVIIYLNNVKENGGGFEYITINNEIDIMGKNLFQ